MHWPILTLCHFLVSIPLSPSSIWLLLRNPTFVLLCLAGATEATLIAGMSTFGPKFFEAQFSLSASEAATLFGKETQSTGVLCSKGCDAFRLPSGWFSKREGRVTSCMQATLPTTHDTKGLGLAIPVSHSAGAPESWGGGERSKFESLYLPDRTAW